MTKTLNEIVTGTWSLLVGMSVTWRWMWKPPVTVSYPQQPSTPAATHKGRIRFVTFAETGTHDCIACLLCQKTCPSDCFTIVGGKPVGGGKKRPTTFTYNLPTCSLCSLCIEVCPTGTLEHSPEHNLASTEKSVFKFDFLAGAKPPVEPVAAPKIEVTPEPAKGEPHAAAAG